MVRRRSAKPVTVVRFRYAPQEDRYCFSAGLLRFGNTHSGGGASTARNTRSSHVLADEITWEQYILKKCPCRPVERCFSETQCSQVGVFVATWEQCVPNNRPYRPLQGRFCKIYCFQVFRPVLSAFPPTTFVIVTNQNGNYTQHEGSGRCWHEGGFPRITCLPDGSSGRSRHISSR